MASGYLTLKALVGTYIVALPERVPHYTTFRTIMGKIKIHGKKIHLPGKHWVYLLNKPSLGLETGHFCSCPLSIPC